MTTLVTVTDIRKNWTKVAKKIKPGSKVVVMGRSKPLYQITPFQEDEYIEYLTDEQAEGIYKSKEQIAKGQYTAVETQEDLEKYFDKIRKGI